MDVHSAPDWDRRSVLSRALALLDAFHEGETVLSVAELTRRVALPKTTVHRMVADLVHHGLLERCGRDVALGVHLFELGCRVPVQRRLRDTGLPFMHDLYRATREAVFMGVRDGEDVLCILRVIGHEHHGVTMAEGDRLPGCATAMGKAMLAFSPRAMVSGHDELVPELAAVARSGVAFACDEPHPGQSAVAAPVFAPGRVVVGALSVVGPTYRLDPGRLANAVRVAAAGVSRRLAPAGGHDPALAV